MPAPNEITPQQLMRLIGTPDAPILVDLRIDVDFDEDPNLIPTAFRHSHDQIDQLVHRFANRHLVLLCHKGRKISQGAASLLRLRGLTVETLQGGSVAWASANLPTVKSAKLPHAHAGQPTRWVTRHRPKIDRIACPWLIRRFIDPTAEFLFVPPQDVEMVAEKFSAVPFDVEDVQFSHRGDACSFDSFLADYNLQIPALDKMAEIIRGADTNRHDLAAQAAGLLALSLGLSRMFKDDLAQLDAGLLLYDALYRWARDASEEGHDWPATSGKS